MVREAPWVVWLLVTGLMTGCGSGSAPEEAAPPPDETPPPVVAPAVADSRLLALQWRLEAFGAVGAEKPVLYAAKIKLIFNEDGTLDGFGGCNTYRTTYSTGAAGDLAVRAIVQSDAACPPAISRQETVYLDVLHRAESYEVHDDRLIVFYEGGSRNLLYRGGPDADAVIPQPPPVAAPDRPTSSSDQEES